MKQKFRELLVWAHIPQLYWRIAVWWEFHSNLRDQVKAARMFLRGCYVRARNEVFGSVMLVSTRQIQSREELRDMSYKQIMTAYRGGRLEYLMHRSDGINGYGRDTFYEWVKNGGQVHP